MLARLSRPMFSFCRTSAPNRFGRGSSRAGFRLRAGRPAAVPHSPPGRKAGPRGSFRSSRAGIGRTRRARFVRVRRAGFGRAINRTPYPAFECGRGSGCFYLGMSFPLRKFCCCMMLPLMAYTVYAPLCGWARNSNNWSLTSVIGSVRLLPLP